MSDRVSLSPLSGTFRVKLGGELVAESASAYVVHEKGLPDRTYVPRSDVRAELVDNGSTGSCPWKGKWRHLDVRVAGRAITNGAWTYDEPTPVCEPVRDFVCFYPDKFDPIERDA